jgi:hypothetical protein
MSKTFQLTKYWFYISFYRLALTSSKAFIFIFTNVRQELKWFKKHDTISPFNWFTTNLKSWALVSFIASMSRDIWLHILLGHNVKNLPPIPPMSPFKLDLSSWEIPQLSCILFQYLVLGMLMLLCTLCSSNLNRSYVHIFSYLWGQNKNHILVKITSFFGRKGEANKWSCCSSAHPHLL